jgi:sugar phosphate isomerase/epimerase
MRELDAYGYTGPLMLEINNKPERYQSMTAEEFVNTAFERVCRLAAL